MNPHIKIPTILTSSVINLFNNLIKNKGINIKKLYSLDNNLLEDNLFEFKNIYCKNRTTKNKLCLNKCIENSKYCKIHDPIMKEQKRINRINMNIKKRSLKQCIKEEISLLSNIDYNLPSTPPYEEINHKGIISQSIESIPPPNYEQKPDEVGKQIINQVNINKYNPIFINDIINKSEKIIQSPIRLHPMMLYNTYATTMNIIKNYNREINAPEELKPLLSSLLAIGDNGRPIEDIEKYQNKLNNIDYSIFNNYKGPKIHKLTENIIKTQIKAYYFNNPNNIYNSSITLFINNIIKHIPK